MKIVGIDPGIGRVGWAVIEVQSAKCKVQNYGCLETSAKNTLAERLLVVHKFIVELLEKHKPDALSVEELFFGVNAKTAFAVGQARGVVLLAASEKRIPVFSYTPPQVKLAVTGYGKADKTQVGLMVKAILKLEKLPKIDDTTDALAVALAHAFSHKIRGLSS